MFEGSQRHYKVGRPSDHFNFLITRRLSSIIKCGFTLDVIRDDSQLYDFDRGSTVRPRLIGVGRADVEHDSYLLSTDLGCSGVSPTVYNVGTNVVLHLFPPPTRLIIVLVGNG